VERPLQAVREPASLNSPVSGNLNGSASHSRRKIKGLALHDLIWIDWRKPNAPAIALSPQDQQRLDLSALLGLAGGFLLVPIAIGAGDVQTQTRDDDPDQGHGFTQADRQLQAPFARRFALVPVHRHPDQAPPSRDISRDG
jgi:hypothetical protein